MQLDRKISESSAETYLDGSFIIFDAKKMSNEAKFIFAKNDIWQAFKFSDGGKAQAMDYERSMMMGMQVPPLPPNIPFVSRDEFFHAKDLAARALEETKSLARSDTVCAAILKEFNESLPSSFHARLVPILKSMKHNHAKILAMRQFVEQTMLGDPLEDRLSIVKAIKESENVEISLLITFVRED